MYRSRSATAIILTLGSFLMPAGISVAEETRYGFGQPTTQPPKQISRHGISTSHRMERGCHMAEEQCSRVPFFTPRSVPPAMDRQARKDRTIV